MEPEIIVTRTARVWLGEDGIVRGAILPDLELNEADAQENVAAFARAGKGQKKPVLVDISHIRKGLTREARAYYISEATAKVVSAVALLVGSPISKIIGNFFLGLNKPQMPLQLFTDESEAVKWLKGFI
ncbi:MAG: hypothetical protein Q7T89_04535 [Anaerolineales bacterium]|nr:hypothetical protein [Anaerolineales bacterium]